MATINLAVVVIGVLLVSHFKESIDRSMLRIRYVGEYLEL
jgi:hypothetical protein